LTRDCDNHCIVCAQEGADVEVASWAEALEGARRDHAAVTFVGGEPLLAPDLTDAIACAQALGYLGIGIQTNAVTLAPGRIAELVDAGLTDVHLSIHGAAREVHDYHTGRPGSFVAIAGVLDELRSRDVTVVATTVVTRSNFRVLSDLPSWLHARGVAAWACRWPTVAGRAASGFDRVIPRLGLAIPFVLHAQHSARALGLPSVLVGAPLCTLGPHAHAVLAAPPRHHPAPCSTCAIRADCPGVDEAYAIRHGTDELHPRAERPDPDLLPPSLAAMFVGIGALGPTVVATAPSPAAARARLPVLGRPSPAQHEIRKRSEAHDPAALARLFPALFDDDPDD
jgi:hypothetical protein